MTTEAKAADYEAAIEQLNKRNAEQNKEISELKSAVTELTALVTYLKEQFKLSQHRRFGSPSEKFAHAEQLSLFGNPEPKEQTGDPAQTETISYTRKKRVGKRAEDLSKLPAEYIDYDIPECPTCGETMEEIGVDTRDELKMIPAKMMRVVHRRKVRKCVNCTESTGKAVIVKADAPEPLIRGSVASASVIAYIMTQKYLMHLPLYRMEQDFKRQGIYLSRQNMANWIIQVCIILELIYDRLRIRLLEHDNIHSDDTGVLVLSEPYKETRSKSTMWLYRTGSDSKTPVAYYEYQPNRRGCHIKNFLGDWQGYCHADGFPGYHSLENVIIIGCWSHARRKFFDAFKVTGACGTPAKIGLDYCKKLFDLEQQFSEMTAEERFNARNKFSVPIAEELFRWAETVYTIPKTATHTAVTYLLNQKEWLMNVFLDGRLELSNNRGERSIKPFVMGRKNWLFSNSVSGVKASAIVFSIIETAKENGLNPFEYVKYLLETLPSAPLSQVDRMMPWSYNLPEKCYAPK